MDTISATDLRDLIAKKLGGKDARLNTNWTIEDIKVSKTNRGRDAYVRVTCDNLDGVIFFDDLRALERDIKKKVRGAWNFAMMKTSPSKPQFSFCI